MHKKKEVIIIGGVGNGSVIAGAIRDANNRGFNDITVKGYFSDRILPGNYIEGLPVLAKTSADNIKRYNELGCEFIFTVYRIDGQDERLNLFNTLGLSKDNLCTFIHPMAFISSDVVVSEGCVVMPYVMISSSVEIKMGTIIMAGATIGHNTILGRHNHIASQAVVGAYIKTGEGVHIGLNSTIRENASIGNNSTIGMGAVLLNSIGENEIWAGNPAKYLRKAL